MNAIEAFIPSKIVETFAAFLEFCYIARRNIITDDSLEQLKTALHNFHRSCQVFSGTVRAEGLLGFSLPRQHSMVHYYDHIKNFGSPNGLCSSITESKHIAAVKRPWRRSNKHAALPQMLRINERVDKLAAARSDFTVRGMMTETCLIQAIRSAFSGVAGDSEDHMGGLDAYDSDETDDSTSNGVDVPDRRHAPNSANSLSLDDAGARPRDDVPNINDDQDFLPPPPEDEDFLPPPPDDEDDDHGPVESGPLMNEVRLACRRG